MVMRLVPDWVWAVMTIWQECQGEDFDSKVAVAEVIRQRTRLKYMSDGTVPGTVLWPLQFSGWNSVDPSPKYRERIECAKLRTDDPVVKECMAAWEKSVGSSLSKGAVLYYNPKICKPSWAKNCVVVARVGAHEFLIPKGMEEG